MSTRGLQQGLIVVESSKKNWESKCLLPFDNSEVNVNDTTF